MFECYITGAQNDVPHMLLKLPNKIVPRFHVEFEMAVTGTCYIERNWKVAYGWSMQLSLNHVRHRAQQISVKFWEKKRKIKIQDAHVS